ncbi:MAG: MFS transporter [Firmicutes bacterium]|nr:MFS transporter [Bacillota bacterium]
MDDTKLSVAMPDDYGKIPLKEKLIFGMGDIFGSGWAALTAVVLFFFFNNVVGLDAGHAGLIVALAKIVDAVTDSLFGIISDNLRTKWGRRRPMIFVGALLIIPALAFLFADTSSLNSYWGRFTISLLAFCFFCSINSLSQVPYSSMVSDISPDHKERTNANTIKTIFNMVGAAVCFLVPTMVMEQLDKGEIPYITFYLIIVLGFGLLFTIPLILTSFFTKERTPYLDIKVKFSFNEYKKPFKIKAFVLHLIMYVTAFFCMDVVGALAMYYARDVLRDVSNPIPIAFFGGDRMSTIFVTAPIMVMAAVMFPVIMYLMRKYNKQTAYRTGLPLYILGGLGLAIFNPGWTTLGWLVPIFAVITGIGFAGAQIMPWIIFADTIDVAEFKMGSRPTGTFSGVMTFSRKIANALAIFMVGQILSLAGQVPGLGAEMAQLQPKSALTAISLTMGITIAVVMTFAFIVSLKYKVNSAKLLRVRYFIDKAKTGEPLTEEEITEKAELTAELADFKPRKKKAQAEVLAVDGTQEIYDANDIIPMINETTEAVNAEEVSEVSDLSELNE